MDGGYGPPSVQSNLKPVICTSLDPLPFTAHADMKQPVTWLQTLDTNFFCAGIQALVA
jgi:hypothetical protein